jgi:hypothetical protein
MGQAGRHELVTRFTRKKWLEDIAKIYSRLP